MSTLTIEFAQCRYRLTDVEVEVMQSAKPGHFIGKPIGPVEYRISLRLGSVNRSQVLRNSSAESPSRVA